MLSAHYGHCHPEVFIAPYGHCHLEVVNTPYGHCHSAVLNAPYGRCHSKLFSAPDGHYHSAPYLRSAVVMNVPVVVHHHFKRCSSQSVLPLQHSVVPKIQE